MDVYHSDFGQMEEYSFSSMNSGLVPLATWRSKTIKRGVGFGPRGDHAHTAVLSGLSR